MRKFTLLSNGDAAKLVRFCKPIALEKQTTAARRSACLAIQLLIHF